MKQRYFPICLETRPTTMINYNQRRIDEEFRYGITLQVCPLTSFKSSFRLRTVSIGHHLRPTYRIIGSGIRMVYRMVTVKCTILKGIGSSFDVKFTTQTSPVDSVNKILEFHNCLSHMPSSSMILPELNPQLTQYTKKLSPGINSWYFFDSNEEASKIKVQLIGCMRDIFKTERGAETYFHEVLKNNMKNLFDYNNLDDKEKLDKLFEDLYDYEVSIDKERSKKKGADKRLLTKICSFMTIIIVCTNNTDVGDELRLMKEGGLSIKETAKQGFISVIEDFYILLKVLDGIE